VGFDALRIGWARRAFPKQWGQREPPGGKARTAGAGGRGARRRGDKGGAARQLAAQREPAAGLLSAMRANPARASGHPARCTSLSPRASTDDLCSCTPPRDALPSTVPPFPLPTPPEERGLRGCRGEGLARQPRSGGERAAREWLRSAAAEDARSVCCALPNRHTACGRTLEDDVLSGGALCMLSEGSRLATAHRAVTVGRHARR